jgi:glyoxylase-like metal-dependent hydrolase (beta-lactamase superfamily II)
MRIAEGVEMLEISGSVMGTPSVIRPTLVWDAETVVLVDTGFPGMLPLIREAMDKAGVPFDRLNRVILTHHDIDHIGSLASIRGERADRVTIMAHEIEKPYVDGTKPALKLAQFEANRANLPPERQAVFQKMAAAFQSSRASVDETLVDGEELPYAGGIRVIHTPGHTLGHICLYLERSKTLVSGDALTVDKEGVLVRSQPSINYDTPAAVESLKKLAPYDIQAVITHHGGLARENVNARIAELAKG